MTIQALLHKEPYKALCSTARRVAHLGSSGVLSEDHVLIHFSGKAGEPHIITINCTDRLGLACDIARTIFEFCLNVVQADFSTDGKWCLLLFWVIPRRGSAQSVEWVLLKERLISECPSPSPSLFMQFDSKTCTTKKKFYLLQTCSADRLGLLNDIAYTLWKLDLEVLKVNALTSPNGSAVHVFILRDIRTKTQGRRQEAICKDLKAVLGISHSLCKLSLTSIDDLNETSDLEMLHGVPAELLSEDLSPHAVEAVEAASDASKFSLNVESSPSSSHMLLQIACCDRRGLLYDCLRGLRELNLQVAYGRFTTTSSGSGAMDLFVSQVNGEMLLDLEKQRSLQVHLKLNLCEPIRVAIVTKGMNMELLVAITLEKSGRARPHVLNDVTLALKMLQISIFKAVNEKVSHSERMWELYMFLLAEQPSSSLTSRRMRIVERVMSVLMG